MVRLTIIAIAAALMNLLMPGLVHAQQCEAYRQYTHWISRGEFDEPSNYGEAGGIAVVGNYAYVANQRPLFVGIEIFDISDPYHLVSVGSTPTSGSKGDIAVVGNRAYVTTSSTGLEVIDVQDPTNPAVIGTVGIPGNPSRVAVSGDYAYVAAYDSGLVVVDVSVDTAPVIVGSISFQYRVDDVAIQGIYAYLSNFNNLQIVDISTPSAPLAVGTLTFGSGYATSVGVWGDYAYLGRLSGGRGFYAIDVSDPTNPSFAGDVQGMNVYEFVIDESFAYLCAGDFRVIDISTPGAPQELVRVPTRGDDVAVAGGYAFLGGGNTVWPDVQVVELGVHAIPSPIGAYHGLDNVYRIDAEGSLAYVLGTIGASSWQLRSLDMTTPSSPQALDSLAFSSVNFDRAMDATGGLAAVAFDDDLHIIDVSTPTAMTRESVTPIGCCPSGIEIAGSYVYFTWADQLRVFDASTPSAPVEGTPLVLNYYGHGLDIVGSFAYVASDYAGVQVVDLSTPSSPTLRGTMSDLYFDVITVEGDYAYCAGYYSFAVVDISDPDIPSLVAARAMPGDAYDIAVASGVVAVTMHSSQTQFFDVSTPSAPVAIGNTAAAYPSAAYEVVMQGDAVVIAAAGAGVQVYPEDCGSPSSSVGGTPSVDDVALRAWPNPFNPATTIRFQVPRETHVSLRVYDVSGRLVRTLVQGRRDARVHEVSWNGTNDRGDPVSSGVYFLRLKTDASVEVHKTVLLK